MNFGTFKKVGAAVLPIALYVGERLVSDKVNEVMTRAMVAEEVTKQMDERKPKEPDTTEERKE